MVIETERLVMRRMELFDYENLCKMLQDDEVMYAYGGAFRDEEAQAWLEKQMGWYEEGVGLYGVVVKETGEMIGQCGLTWQKFRGKKVLEIGYLFQKKYWHKGYATEAARAWKEYAFDVLGAEEVFSIIRDTNLASQKVAMRNGMVRVGGVMKHYRGADMPHFVFSVKNIK